MKLETARSLHDILIACQRIEGFTVGATLEEYRSDLAMQLVVERLLMVVGEATTRIARSDPAVVQLLPEHQRIIGLRNRIAHEYDEIDNDIIWDIVVTRAPKLREIATTLLQAQGRESDEVPAVVEQCRGKLVIGHLAIRSRFLNSYNDSHDAVR